MNNIESVTKLTAYFATLPGVGGKTAARYAYHVINMGKEEAIGFSEAIIAVKENVMLCKTCGNFTDKDECDICSLRDPGTICVVKEPKDVLAIEKIKEYKGVYHVLHGTLNPIKNIGPNDINIKNLVLRAAGADEIIMATNTDVEGEATAMYIAKLLKPSGIRITRIAHGIPVGSNIEYADEMTLMRAIADRKEIL